MHKSNFTANKNGLTEFACLASKIDFIKVQLQFLLYKATNTTGNKPKLNSTGDENDNLIVRQITTIIIKPDKLSFIE